MSFPFVLWILPLVITTLVSIYKPFFVSRYLFFTLPGYVLTIGLLAEVALGRHGRLAVTGATAFIVALSIPAADRIWGSGMANENWHAAESYVASHYQPNDRIVIPIAHMHAFGYYASRDRRIAHTQPVWSIPYGKWTAPYQPVHYNRRAAAVLAATLQEPHRYWIIIRRTPQAALTHAWQSRVVDPLRRSMRDNPLEIRSTRSFEGVTVYCYSPAPATTTPANPLADGP